MRTNRPRKGTVRCRCCATAQKCSPTQAGLRNGQAQAKFVSLLLRFNADDFPCDRFTGSIYKGVSTHGHFGFIAHYDTNGF